jgi:hypothetical protein
VKKPRKVYAWSWHVGVRLAESSQFVTRRRGQQAPDLSLVTATCYCLLSTIQDSCQQVLDRLSKPSPDQPLPCIRPGTQTSGPPVAVLLRFFRPHLFTAHQPNNNGTEPFHNLPHTCVTTIYNANTQAFTDF